MRHLEFLEFWIKSNNLSISCFDVRIASLVDGCTSDSARILWLLIVSLPFVSSEPYFSSNKFK